MRSSLDRIKSHEEVMPVASQNLHGREMDSNLIHVPATDTWGPSPAGGRGKAGTLGTRRSVHQIRGKHMPNNLHEPYMSPLQTIEFPNSNTTDAKYNPVSVSNTPLYHTCHTRAERGDPEVATCSPYLTPEASPSPDKGLCLHTLFASGPGNKYKSEMGRRKRQIVSWLGSGGMYVRCRASGQGFDTVVARGVCLRA